VNKVRIIHIFSIIRASPPPPLALIIEITILFQQYFSSLQNGLAIKSAYGPLNPALCIRRDVYASKVTIMMNIRWDNMCQRVVSDCIVYLLHTTQIYTVNTSG
jgi:hypothetical protein